LSDDKFSPTNAETKESFRIQASTILDSSIMFGLGNECETW